MSTRSDIARGRVRRRCGGFSIMETLITVSLSAVLIIGLVMTTTVGIRSIRGLREAGRVHAQSEFLIERIAYVVRQGAALSVPAASSLTVTLPDLARTERMFSLGDGRARLDSAPVTAEDVRVTSLRFSVQARSVRIGFTVVSAKDPSISLSATTTVALRNSF